jgi:hypothetical protein
MLLTTPVNTSYFFYAKIDIKKISEEFWTNAPNFNVRHTKSPNILCYFICDTRIKPAQQNVHSNNSNEGYVTVEFKIHNEWSLRCTLVWRNAENTLHFPSFQLIGVLKLVSRSLDIIWINVQASNMCWF